MLFLYKQLPVGMIIYHCSVNYLETEDFFLLLLLFLFSDICIHVNAANTVFCKLLKN